VKVIGLMSGTSLDGIDAALIEIEGDVASLQWSLVAFVGKTYKADQRDAIHAAIAHGTAADLCRLHADLGDWLADAALAVAAEAGTAMESIDVIGSHGQTVWHIAPEGAKRGATLQLGCPATIAERTGVSVVSDFRTRDVAAGGHGAPLVPWADRLLFADRLRPRVLVNIGGMANLSWVPQRGSSEPVLAFDTGPGNVLIDAAVEIATDGAQTFDEDGAIARSGVVQDAMLAELLDHEFFRRPPPRSTGRELFGRPQLQELVGRSGQEARDAAHALVPTLTELTARSIADSIRTWLAGRDIGDVVITGGGARNTWLVERMRSLLAPMVVRTGPEVGIDADAKEAIVFAALAWAHVNGIPGNLPAATGASGPRVLGSFTPGRRDVARL
jgi:anhydro-N-acetylmuramic acid kinase